MNYDHKRNIYDIDEAIRLSNQILDSLSQAEQNLSSARNWGVVDMPGGGFFTNMVKHSKINKASDELVYTKELMHRLQHQIEGIHFTEDLYVDIDGFAVFADFFFDGLIADWYVQSKIKSNQEKVQRAKAQIREVQYKLDNLKRYEQSYI